LVRGCPTVDIGGEGAVGGAPYPLVVVAAMPQSVGCSFDSWSGSVVVGNSEVWLSAKVQPSFVLTVVAADILLIRGCWFFGVFLVEFAYNIWGVFEVFGWVPDLVRVVETGPLNPILDLVPVSS